MAQNQFINVVLDPSAAGKQVTDHRNTGSQSSAATSDFTVSFDSAKITTITALDSAYATARKIAAGQLKP
jgi:hypothetical protein